MFLSLLSGQSQAGSRRADTTAPLCPDYVVLTGVFLCKSVCCVCVKTKVQSTVSMRQQQNDVLQYMPTKSQASAAAPHTKRRSANRCERKQKRGKCGGPRARLAASPNGPAIQTFTSRKWTTYVF